MISLTPAFSLLCFFCCCSAAQPCPTLRPQGLQPTRLLRPWDSLGRNPGVGCWALLQGTFPTWDRTPISCPHRQILYRWAAPTCCVSWCHVVDDFSDPCLLFTSLPFIGPDLFFFPFVFQLCSVFRSYVVWFCFRSAWSFFIFSNCSYL